MQYTEEEKYNISGGTKSNLWNVGFIFTMVPEVQEISEVHYIFAQ